MSISVFPSDGWGNSSSISYSYASTSTAWPTTARLVFDDVPVTPPTPKTEVQRLLADVEATCALAR